MVRILVADDDPFGRRYAETVLTDAGFAVTTVADGLAALEAFHDADPIFDLVLTDVRMPGLTGIQLIERIRDEDSRIAVIAISMLGSDTQILAGLEAGADDYLTKPISGPVLLAKVRVALRRADPSFGAQVEAILEVGDLRLDPAARMLTRNGEPVALTRTELAVVEYLMRNAGRIVSPVQILSAVWGEAYELENEILRTAVKRVRRKLDDDSRQSEIIRTHVGLGYSIGYGG